MSNKLINNLDSYELGKMAGRKEAISKQIECHFDYMKKFYTNAVGNIYDEKIIEELFDNPSIFSTYRSRDELELIMNAVRIAVSEYEKVQEKEDKING